MLFTGKAILPTIGKHAHYTLLYTHVTLSVCTESVFHDILFHIDVRPTFYILLLHTDFWPTFYILLLWYLTYILHLVLITVTYAFYHGCILVLSLKFCDNFFKRHISLTIDVFEIVTDIGLNDNFYVWGI